MWKNFSLAPLFDVVTNEKIYAKLVEVLPILKSSLRDVNNLKNNPFFSKIESNIKKEAKKNKLNL